MALSLYQPLVYVIYIMRVSIDAHAVTRLNSWLGWQASFGDLYVSNPPTGIKKNDLILSTGLRLTFGGVAP